MPMTEREIIGTPHTPKCYEWDGWATFEFDGHLVTSLPITQEWLFLNESIVSWKHCSECTTKLGKGERPWTLAAVTGEGGWATRKERRDAYRLWYERKYGCKCLCTFGKVIARSRCSMMRRKAICWRAKSHVHAKCVDKSCHEYR